MSEVGPIVSQFLRMLDVPSSSTHHESVNQRTEPVDLLSAAERVLAETHSSGS